MRAWLETMLITLAGGAAFTLLHIPLSWMLGPLSAAMLWTAFTKRQLQWPVTLREGGLAVLGYMMGITFTKETGIQIVMQLPSMLTATLLTIVFSLAMAYIIAWKTDITMASSAIGNIPGGLSQMVVLSEEVNGADRTVVTFMQTIRLLSVIFMVPFLAVHGLADQVDSSASAAKQAAGLADWLAYPYISLAVIVAVPVSCLLAARLRLPIPYMLGPIVTGAVMVVSGMHVPHLPPWLIIVAQWVMGAHMGATTRLSSLANWKKLLPYSIISSVGVVLFSLIVAYVLSLLHPISFLTAFLSTAPGGISEMGVTAAVTHADITMIVAYQMFRMLFILFLVPPVLKWGLRRFFPA
jgi:hypothetical protein